MCADMALETVRFVAAVREYYLTTTGNETLQCLHDAGNIYDMFSIKTCLHGVDGGRIVGHLNRSFTADKIFGRLWCCCICHTVIDELS